MICLWYLLSDRIFHVVIMMPLKFVLRISPHCLVFQWCRFVPVDCIPYMSGSFLSVAEFHHGEAVAIVCL